MFIASERLILEVFQVREFNGIRVELFLGLSFLLWLSLLLVIIQVMINFISNHTLLIE